ncbi:hypothetical protein BK742_19735 [Bacillus thuringiensis serovar pingluonsis]|uniref:Uncharacterized protein n=1 Tax=Bacillus thuringiensis serovar pingluonsis TaxID=180881 RepID=A0A243B6S0_BACTU|nr:MULTISPECIES: oligosaccharide flippase family protein [Bacillus cereus group]MCU5552163.1 oligosaccharide flippase family protein [Bacillus cereus]MEB9680557.1 oligosaccharide flippase family protein [Bacillus anthracis]OTY40658.1 hypothetical protein BK742_19735 [Bacillus thuringiensis serovar pingluonsis]
MDNKIKSIVLLLSKTFTVCLNLISIMIISRYLSVEVFSEYRQIIIAITLVVSIASLGLPSAALYFMSSEKRNIYLPNFYVVMLVLNILLIPVCALGIYYFDYNFNTDLFTNYFWLFLILFLLSFTNASIENIFIAFNQFKLIILVSLLPNFFFIVQLLLFLYGGKGIKGIVLALLLREVLKIVILFYFIYKTKFEIRDVSLVKIREIIMFSVPIGLASIIGVININLDKLITGKLLSKEEFAMIATASYEIPVLGLIGMSLFNILIPSLKNKYNESNNREIIDLWMRAGKVMITIIVPITIALIIFAKEVIVILFSDNFLNATNLFRIYQLNALARIYYYGAFFLALGLNRLYTINSIINLISNLFISFFLIIKFGVVGAAIAIVINTYFLVFIQCYQIAKTLDVNIKQIFPVYELIKGIVITGSITLSIYGIYIYIFTFNLWIGLIMMILAVIICVIVLNLCINDEILKYGNKIFWKLRDKKYVSSK